MAPVQEPGYRRSGKAERREPGPYFLDRDPAFRAALPAHILFEQIGKKKGFWHDSSLRNGGGTGKLPAARPMPAGMACVFGIILGMAAAGFTEF